LLPLEILITGFNMLDDVDDDSNDSVRGMSDLMLVEFLMCVLPLALIVALFKDGPLTPPSKSTQLKNDQLLLKDALRQLGRNWDYLILFCTFSIGVGFFNSLMTLLNQLIAPFGYRCLNFYSAALHSVFTFIH